MLAFPTKIWRSLQSDGLSETIHKIAKYPWRENWHSVEQRVLSLRTLEERFTEIYKSPNYWGNRKTVSGHGSTMLATENLRSSLPALFEKFSVKRIFDAPCGDFNWMSDVTRKSELEYIGGDIVSPLIEDLKSKYQDAKTKFVHIDLTKEAFPEADLMICRDCLFHLSFEDARRILQNFAASRISYLLTSTHVHASEFQNVDIVAGRFRPIDLFIAPYNLPREVLYRIDDWRPPYQPREMCLWTRDQIAASLQ